jgi:pimeloyl-ACP methyl ester carboxylesterase
MPAGEEAEETGVVRRRIRGAGLELALTERGDPSRPTVVLIHGFPNTSAAWDPVARHLSTKFHVVTYDVRGAGASDVPKARADYALPVLVEDLAAVIDAVSPDAPVHLVGHDWGSIQGWEAVTSGRLDGGIASYTSISGPPIDHAALWARRHRTRRTADLRLTLSQGLHSWYIVAFHLPYLSALVLRVADMHRSGSQAWRRRKGTVIGPHPSSSTMANDFAHGLELYRANVLQRLRHPVQKRTTTPVLVIVPTLDRYITPALLEGIESWSALTWRREVNAGHWVIQTHPGQVAAWVGQVIDFVEDGTASDELTRCRLAPVEGGASISEEPLAPPFGP